MSNLKCPFCQQELDKFGYYFGATPIFLCNNCNLFGGLKLWQELIRTRKVLGVAVDALTRCQNNTPDNYTATQAVFLLAQNSVFIDKALEQITALEQKE